MRINKILIPAYLLAIIMILLIIPTKNVSAASTYIEPLPRPAYPNDTYGIKYIYFYRANDDTSYYVIFPMGSTPTVSVVWDSGVGQYHLTYSPNQNNKVYSRITSNNTLAYYNTFTNMDGWWLGANGMVLDSNMTITGWQAAVPNPVGTVTLQQTNLGWGQNNFAYVDVDIDIQVSDMYKPWYVSTSGVDGSWYNPFLDNGDLKPLYNDSGQFQNYVYSETISYQSKGSVGNDNYDRIKGTLRLKVPNMQLGLNSFNIYIKTVDGSYHSSVNVQYYYRRDGEIVDKNLDGVDDYTGQQIPTQKEQYNNGDPPKPEDYEWGVTGMLKFVGDSIAYYFTYPFRMLASLLVQLSNNLRDFLAQANGINDYLTQIIGALPSWITTPIATIFTLTVVISILKLFRG